MKKITKLEVISNVKKAITKQEFIFRGPRLLEMWHRGSIYLPGIDITKEESLNRLSYPLRGGEKLRSQLCLSDVYINNVVKEVSSKYNVMIDTPSQADATVNDLCNAFLTALSDRLCDDE